MIDILKIIFYLSIAIPFIYMISDVFLFVMRNIYGVYSEKLKPVILLVISRY
jgi:hypothetical protein